MIHETALISGITATIHVSSFLVLSKPAHAVFGVLRKSTVSKLEIVRLNYVRLKITAIVLQQVFYNVLVFTFVPDMEPRVRPK